MRGVPDSMGTGACLPVAMGYLVAACPGARARVAIYGIAECGTA